MGADFTFYKGAFGGTEYLVETEQMVTLNK